MKRAFVLSVVASSALLIASSVTAKPTYLSAIPNGMTNSCNTCHTSTSPVAWNSFGEDVAENLIEDTPDWAALCGLDSDGDGASNGLELGDVDCAWIIGDANPAGDVYHPGDAASTPPAEVDDGDDGTSDDGEDGNTDDGTEDGDEGNTDEDETTEVDDGTDGDTDEGSTDEGADAPSDEGEGAEADAEEGADSDSNAEDGAEDAGEEGADAGAGESAADDGGCQGGSGAPMSAFFALMCVALIARRTLHA